MLKCYKRGAWWWIGGKNSVGTVIERHSTKCRVKGADGKVSDEGKKAAGAYLRSIDTATEWPLQAKEPEPAPKAKLTLPQSLEEYLTFKRPKHTDKTREIARWAIGQHVIEPLAQLKVTTVDQLTQKHFVNLQDGWLNQLADETLAFNTMAMFRRQSNAWLTYLADSETSGLNSKHSLWKGVPWPKSKHIATLPLDEDDDHVNWRRVRASIIPFLLGTLPEQNGKRPMLRTNPLWQNPETFLAFLELMYETGLRRSDALRFDPRVLRLTELGNWAYTTEQKKTEKSVTVWLEPWLATKLKALPRLEPTGLPFYDGRIPEADYLDHYVADPLRDLGKLLGFPEDQPLRCHRFRDSFAVNFLNSGGSLEDLRDLLGHQNIAITERYYDPKGIRSRKNAIEKRLVRARAQQNPSTRLTVVSPAA